MMGAIYSAIAGLLICLQGIFNARVGEKIGLWETTVLVHGVGLVFALGIWLLVGSGNFQKINETPVLYLSGGMLGVLIVFSAMKGISSLGAGLSIGILLTVQLLCATLLDHYGLFGLDTAILTYNKMIGLALMIGGIVVFSM